MAAWVPVVDVVEPAVALLGRGRQWRASVVGVRDLAPDIVRQRLLIEGYYTTDVDEAAIRRFLRELPAALDLRAYGDPTVHAPAGAGRDSNEGYDAFVPLIDSGISLYVWTSSQFLALVIFTCKAFDPAHALRFTTDFFVMSEVEHTAF